MNQAADCMPVNQRQQLGSGWGRACSSWAALLHCFPNATGATANPSVISLCCSRAAATTWHAPRMRGAPTIASSTRRVSAHGLKVTSAEWCCLLGRSEHALESSLCPLTLPLHAAGGVPHTCCPVPSGSQAAVAVRATACTGWQLAGSFDGPCCGASIDSCAAVSTFAHHQFCPPLPLIPPTNRSVQAYPFHTLPWRGASRCGGGPGRAACSRAAGVHARRWRAGWRA